MFSAEGYCLFSAKFVQMLLAKHHEESDNNHDEPSSEPSPERKISSTPAHPNSTLEDPAVPETSEPTRNGQEVNYVGEVRRLYCVISIIIHSLILCQYTVVLYHVRL